MMCLEGRQLSGGDLLECLQARPRSQCPGFLGGSWLGAETSVHPRYEVRADVLPLEDHES